MVIIIITITFTTSPQAAPFFLPTIPGLATTFDLSAVAGEGDERAPAVALTSFTAFGKALSQVCSSSSTPFPPVLLPHLFLNFRQGPKLGH